MEYAATLCGILSGKNEVFSAACVQLGVPPKDRKQEETHEKRNFKKICSDKQSKSKCRMLGHDQLAWSQNVEVN